MRPLGESCDSAQGRIVFTLVRRARRRLFCNELLSQGANVVSVAMAAFIGLLLFGTEILNWQWLILIPLAAVATGLFLARRKLPTPYAVAQLIDHRLGLADSISTALHFHHHRPAAGSEEIRQLQFDAARRASESLEARQAVPYAVPRTAYLMAALVLVASSLFALRYGLSRRLDLHPPLARILQQSFGFPERAQAARRSSRVLPPRTLAPEPDDETTLDAERAVPQDLKSDPLSEEPPQAQSGGDEKKDGAESQSRRRDEANRAAPDDSGAEPSDDAASDASRQGDQPDSRKGSRQDTSRQDTSAENSSLLSKVKDAMQNLLSRMKPQSGQSGSQQSSMEQNSKQGKGQQNGGKQESADNSRKQDAGQQAGQQEGQSGDQAESSQDPLGKGTGRNNSEQAGKQPGSGVGSQNGDKSIRQAEQLAAMGKISEIIGKRAANVSGETTVEVQSTSQTLHTPYAQRGAEHSEGGTEIHRDEVPVALQGFVEQYFEQVRREPSPARK